MKNKPYKVTGNPIVGHRIAVPEHTGVKKGDRYMCTVNDDGSLLYVPVAGEKK